MDSKENKVKHTDLQLERDGLSPKVIGLLPFRRTYSLRQQLTTRT